MSLKRCICEKCLKETTRKTIRAEFFPDAMEVFWTTEIPCPDTENPLKPDDDPPSNCRYRLEWLYDAK